MNDLLSLFDLVKKAFNDAKEHPDVMRWQSVAVMAGCAAVRLAADGMLFEASALEGAAEEAQRQRKALEHVQEIAA